MRTRLKSHACRLTAGVLMCLASALAAGPAAAGQQSLIGPYLGAAFKVSKNTYNFGQAPSWTPDGQVLSTQLDSAGLTQIYRSKLNGSDQRCLTCKTVKGPNGLPQDRPRGDWILFESFGQQSTHTGAPGLGGYGGDLYAMRADGSHPYRLTTTSDPNSGKRFSAASGVPYDNFHAYWSPDGKQIVWTHTEANPPSAGGQTWEMLVGDFTVKSGVPSLQNVRVVGKPYGAYETQPWAPDGSGFLFCAAGGYKSPYQTAPPGWGHMQLYYMRLYGRGASAEHPRVTQISDNLPAYQEQSIFTPDMKTVIMMSDRNDTQQSWYDLVVAAAMRTNFDAPDTGTSQTLQFLSDFTGPGGFHSDLYAVDVRTKAIRQLTNFGPYVIPEFFWNQNYTQIIWGLNGIQGSTWTGRFAGISPVQRRVPEKIPASGLYGQPVDMARVGAQAQPIRDSGPTTNVSIAVSPPSHPVPGAPHASRSSDKPTIPSITTSYAGTWLGDLASLYKQAGLAFSEPPLLAAVSQFG